MAWAEMVYKQDVPEPDASETITDAYDWDAGFILKIPGFFRVDPAVKEAELIVRGRSTSRSIPGRAVR